MKHTLTLDQEPVLTKLAHGPIYFTVYIWQNIRPEPHFVIRECNILQRVSHLFNIQRITSIEALVIKLPLRNTFLRCLSSFHFVIALIYNYISWLNKERAFFYFFRNK